MLAALSMLGLQTALGPAAVLQAARHIEATAADDPSAAAARCRQLFACQYAGSTIHIDVN
jgi:hypothetical protein